MTVCFRSSPEGSPRDGATAARTRMVLDLQGPTEGTDGLEPPQLETADPELPTPQTPAEIRDKIMYNKDGTFQPLWTSISTESHKCSETSKEPHTPTPALSVYRFQAGRTLSLDPQILQPGTCSCRSQSVSHCYQERGQCKNC